MKTIQPLVSIITINWNTIDVTSDFLRSVKENNTYNNIELIVVDNASKENPKEKLLSIYPEAKIICNEQNLGFSGGNNTGIKAAKGDYFFIVNNDTEFTPGLIEGLLEVFLNYPKTGMVSPKFHHYFEKGTIEYAGYNSVNIFTGRNSVIGYGEKDQGQHNKLRETNYAHGGAMMVSRSVISDVGLMPEEFFLYYEELDWSMQIKRKGYKIYYQPKSLIYHKQSMTTGKMSPLKTYYLTRNRILFMRRNAPVFGFVVFIIFFLLFTIPKNSAIFFAKGQKKHLKSFWKGILWHFNSKVLFTN